MGVVVATHPLSRVSCPAARSPWSAIALVGIYPSPPPLNEPLCTLCPVQVPRKCRGLRCRRAAGTGYHYYYLLGPLAATRPLSIQLTI